MIALDEARLDELHQRTLRIDNGLELEAERLERLSHDVRVRLRREKGEVRGKWRGFSETAIFGS